MRKRTLKLSRIILYWYILQSSKNQQTPWEIQHTKTDAKIKIRKCESFKDILLLKNPSTKKTPQRKASLINSSKH